MNIDNKISFNGIKELWENKSWTAIIDCENSSIQSLGQYSYKEQGLIHIILATAFANTANKESAEKHIKLAESFGFSRKDIAKTMLFQDFSIYDDSEKLVRQIMFLQPYYLAPSAWTEHIPFAFWLIDSLQPKKIVELGSHYGVSYFAFCQAAKHLKLLTSAFAVDTWQGDEHAGYYSDDVFSQVTSHNATHYAEFSTLLRQTFDEANDYFSDNSVDLLHIDGLHTYEAVKHDFETWLPKMSQRGVVIFHDTNVRTHGFGVYKLIEELKLQYPIFEFLHGYGLAVVGVGSEYNKSIRDLFSAYSTHGAYNITEQFAYLGKACLQRFMLEEGMAVSGTTVGVQLYIPEHDGNYTEANIRHRDIEINKLEFIEFDFKYDNISDKITLRLDPSDSVGLIEIHEMELVEVLPDGERSILNGDIILSSILVEGDAIALRMTPTLQLYAYANDPMIFLPSFDVSAESVFLLRFKIMVTQDSEKIRQAWYSSKTLSPEL